MKIINHIVLFVLLFIGANAHSQLIPCGYDTLIIQHEIIFDGGVDYSGTSVQKDLTSKFVHGGFISEAIKVASFNKHKAINRIGGVGFGHLEYRNYQKKIFKKKNWGFLIKGGYDVFAGAVYSKDLFGLAFYGNEKYRGESISLSGTNIRMMSFQKLGFGLIDAHSKSNVSLNVYNISNSVSVNFRDAELFQNEAGDEIQLMIDGEVELGNSKRFNQGVGLGLDLDFKLPISYGKGRTAYVRLEARNVGFAYMYEKQRKYSMDTAINFSGFKFNQIVGEGALFSDSVSVLDSLGINSTDVNRTVLLPGFIQIGKIVDELSEKKIQSFYGIRLYPTLIYSPYVYAGVHYDPISWFQVGANISYGGFAKFKGGLYTNWKIGNYSLGIGSENVVGLLSKKANGESLYFKLRCAI